MKKRHAIICFLLAVTCIALPGILPESIYSKTTYTYKVIDKHEIKADVYRVPGDEILPVIF